MHGLIICIPWILSRYKKSRDQAMPQPLFLLKKELLSLNRNELEANVHRETGEENSWRTGQMFPYLHPSFASVQSYMSLDKSTVSNVCLQWVTHHHKHSSSALRLPSGLHHEDGCQWDDPENAICNLEIVYATYTFNCDSEMLSIFKKENAQTFPTVNHEM